MAGGAANTPCATSSKRYSDMSNCGTGWSAPSGGGAGARAVAEKLDAELEVELPPCEKYEDMKRASSPAGAGWWYSTGRSPTAAMTGTTNGAEAFYL